MKGSGVAARLCQNEVLTAREIESDMPGLKTSRPAKAEIRSVKPFQVLLVENDNLLLKILFNSLRPGR